MRKLQGDTEGQKEQGEERREEKSGEKKWREGRDRGEGYLDQLHIT